MSRDLPAGWGWPGRARKAHYFPEGSLWSLCGRWSYGGSRHDDMPGFRDCLACARILLDIQIGEPLGVSEAERVRSINRRLKERP